MPRAPLDRLERVTALASAPLARLRAHGGRGRIGFRRLFDRAAFTAPVNFVDYAVVPPRGSIGLHRHGANEEIYLVLSGRGRMRRDRDEFAVGPGSVVVNRPGGRHGLVNTGRHDLRLFVVEVATGECATIGAPNGPEPAMSALALLVAGGRGERLARTHPDRPKALLEVGGVALLDRNLDRLHAAGLTDVWIAVGHRADEIANHLELRRRRLATPTSTPTLIREERPLGTIGALALLPESSRAVVVVNADLLSAIDLRALLAVHADRGADLTIATHFEEHRLKLGEVAVDAEGRVTAYLEKPVKRFRISSGTYVVGARARALLVAGEPCAFPNLVGRALARRFVVVHHDHGAPWLDVNDADDLAAAERLLAAERVRFAESRP